eukprot:CAMPEP_0172587136 /NCGR_PEP_ID=MMETSP1068-20121228/6249_1 /TAXON_ID=35684 /ORGANISM="Pseudopedinella elastica, Strain CCMP716" /LENGTH=208 /DNA_ID=CAMNT_0013382061 /DNA_START=195 /DNA_END=818 /DNA_ORIENTATION=+
MTQLLSSPFFQEFRAVFEGDSLGLEVQKVHDVPVVRRLVRQNARLVGPAEKSGVSVGCVVVAVGSASVTSLPYEEVVKRIKATPRPVAITFQRLHATRDGPPFHGRLWQGYLRTFLPMTGHWTGRFFLLRASGVLQAFAGTDNCTDSGGSGDSGCPSDSHPVLGALVLTGAAARDAETNGGSSRGPHLDSHLTHLTRRLCAPRKTSTG